MKSGLYQGGGGGAGGGLKAVQWNLDLTNYQGTEEMRSLYRGFVKSKTSI